MRLTEKDLVYKSNFLKKLQEYENIGEPSDIRFELGISDKKKDVIFLFETKKEKGNRMFKYFHLDEKGMEEFKKRRIEKGFSMKKLSTIAGISTSAIERIENKKGNATTEVWARIFDALDFGYNIGG